jgi:prepilin-type N-terminal cleavage/methylation domain-containing protein
MAFDSLRHRSHNALRRGFTLIELLVVCAIIIIISAIILFNNNRFGGVVILENLAYDVALSVRQAQVYGIAVQRFGTGSADFTTGYGMHFAANSPTTYILFADADQTGLYDPNQNEVVQSTALPQGYAITNLCTTPATSQTPVCGLTSVDVLFKHPEPDAFISANGVSAIQFPASIQQEAQITLTSPRGDKSTINIYAAGQISVQ